MNAGGAEQTRPTLAGGVVSLSTLATKAQSQSSGRKDWISMATRNRKSPKMTKGQDDQLFVDIANTGKTKMINHDKRIAEQHITKCREAMDKLEYHFRALSERYLFMADQIEPSSPWISVEDRLPDCDKTPDSFGVQVLIWPHATFNGSADSPIAFYGCRITNEPSFYLYGAVLDGVTHWMPLPEGPK